MRKHYIKRTGRSVDGKYTAGRVYEARAITQKSGCTFFEITREDGLTVHIMVGPFFMEVGPQEWFKQEYLIQPHYDVHKMNAAKMFDVPYDHVTSEQRREAKRRAHVIAYSTTFGGQPLREQLEAIKMADTLAASKSIKEELMNQAFPPAAPYPQAPAPIPAAYGVPKTAEQIVQDAQQALADAEAALASKQERDAFREALDNQIKNVQLVALLLNDIRNEAVVGIKTGPRTQFAEHRKMLNEYAEEHGYKLVLVGDKTEAVLVQA